MEWEVPTHASVIINHKIYFDPYALPEHVAPAKYVFITHSHYDHCSWDDIKRIITPTTIFIAPPDVIDLLITKQVLNQTVPVQPDQTYTVNDLTFRTFAAYNQQAQFHPRAKHWVGYNLMLDGQHIVIAGDTDATPELLAQPVDVLFIPIGGTYTMDATAAAMATNQMRPQIVVSIHYGTIVGTNADAQQFSQLVNSPIRVVCPR